MDQENQYPNNFKKTKTRMSKKKNDEKKVEADYSKK